MTSEIISNAEFHRYPSEPVASISLGDQSVRFVVPNECTSWRADTFHKKEPETISWIATFERTDSFVDIGANMGLYTLWAAATRGVSVFAFEPEAQNYALLNRNILLNNLGNQVHAYCLAMSNRTCYGELHLGSLKLGGANHAFGEKVDFQLKPFRPKFSQACFSTTLDSLIEQNVVPLPQHIKIDVDGFEHQVLTGCAKTLECEAVKSVLVELNSHLPEHRAVIGAMAERGFGLCKDQVRLALRKRGRCEGVGNHIFRRDLPVVTPDAT